MSHRFDVEIGDKVRIGKETDFLTVVEINSQTVRIGQKDVELKQLYFKEDHQSEFDWRVKAVIKKGF